MHLVVVICTTSVLAAVSSVPNCSAGKSKLDRFKDMAAGDRAFYVQPSTCFDYATCQGDKNTAYGPKYMISCAAKLGGVGSDSIADPTTNYDNVNHVFEFFSKLPCQFSNQVFAGDTVHPCESQYPAPNPNHTRHPHRPQSSFTPNSWLGPAFKITSVYGESTDCEQAALPHNNGNVEDKAAKLKYCEDLKATDAFVPELLYGVSNVSRCQDPKEGHQDIPNTFYDGGLMISHTRGTYLTTRSFMFKNAEQRALALQDSRNLGLPFAKEFGGAHGCDVEIVMEFKVKSGGGLHFHIGMDLIAFSIENERGLKDGVVAYKNDTTDDIVVLVSRAALRNAQGLPVRPSDQGGYKEVLRFAASFVCKTNTSHHASGTVTFHNANDQGLLISNNASRPTAFQTDPPVTWNKSDIQYLHKSPQFSVHVSPAAAPESCGSMYWDPLVQSVEGDGPPSGNTVYANQFSMESSCPTCIGLGNPVGNPGGPPGGTTTTTGGIPPGNFATTSKRGNTSGSPTSAIGIGSLLACSFLHLLRLP